MATPWRATASSLASWEKAKCGKGEEPAHIGPPESPDTVIDGYVLVCPCTTELPEVHQNNAHKAAEVERQRQARAYRLAHLAEETSDRISLMGILRANGVVGVDEPKKEKVKKEVAMESDEEFYQSESYESEVESEDEFIIKEAEKAGESDNEINLVGAEIIIESDTEVSPTKVAAGNDYQDVGAECYPRPIVSATESANEAAPDVQYSHADVSVTEVAPEADTTTAETQHSIHELKASNKDGISAPPPPPPHRKSRHYRLGYRGERNHFHGITATGSMAMAPRMSVHEQKSLIRPGRYERQPFILSHGIPRDVPEPANQETPKLWQPGRKKVLAALHRGMIPQGRVMTQSEIE